MTLAIAESISSFCPQASPVDQLITLSIGQLKGIIKEAISEAICPLEARIAQLEGIVAQHTQQIAALEQDRDLAADRDLNQLRLINGLREQIKPEPQPLQKDRGDILRAILAANDGKMLLKAARQKMHLAKSRFSELLATMGDYIETKPFSRDHRQKVLILR
jgi:hypothetical protein